MKELLNNRDPQDKIILIERASVGDIDGILRVQRAAYQSEAKLYNNFKITPLTQTKEEVTAQFKDHVILKAMMNGVIVGTVRAYEKNGTCHIGRLAVSPEVQNKGIGKALMKKIEGSFHVNRFELFTGVKSKKNICLYQKLGYSIFKNEKDECGGVEVCYMEKVVK